MAALVSWPDYMPQQFEKDGYQDAFPDNRIATQPELGPALVRSRISAMPRRFSGTMKMAKWQLDALRNFWKYTVLDGKLPFYFPDPVFGNGWRRNWVPNSGYDGAVVGSPGTLPTSWVRLTVNGSNGLFMDVSSVGYEGGLQYVDLHFYGAATGTVGGAAATGVAFANAIASASGTTWTESMYLRQVGGSKDNLYYILTILYGQPDYSESVMLNITSILNQDPLANQRYSMTKQFVQGGMTGVQPRLQIAGYVGKFIDITIRVGGIQVEKYMEATPFIYTPNVANPITRFAANGAPPRPVFLGHDKWAVTMDMEIFEA